MKDVQEHTGLFVAPSQAEALVRSITEVQADILARDVALENLRSGATAQNPEVQRREAELTSLRRHLKALQEKPDFPASGKVTAGSQFPKAGLEHLRRLRDLQYHTSMFEVLAKQYEAARIDEAKEAPLLQIIDPAIAPDRHSGYSVR